jgi:D-3-phosphoglycerate dehydrogenase
MVLINTSRGACINTGDVVNALENQQISGACLDVFENEKTPTFTPEERAMYQRLYKMENVVVMPHIAGWTHESKRRMAEILIEKIHG